MVKSSSFFFLSFFFFVEAMAIPFFFLFSKLKSF